jgi:hypothetical protein
MLAGNNGIMLKPPYRFYNSFWQSLPVDPPLISGNMATIFLGLINWCKKKQQFLAKPVINPGGPLS